MAKVKLIFQALVASAVCLAITASSTHKDYQYEGCFESLKPDSVLRVPAIDGSLVKLSSCHDICFDKGFQFFGLRAGSSCYCGEVMHNSKKTPGDQCGWRCFGDPSDACGTDTTIRVFRFLNKMNTKEDQLDISVVTPAVTNPAFEAQVDTGRLKQLKFIKCKQVSTLNNHNCNEAIDGDITADASKRGSCSDTKKGDYTWWSATTFFPASFRAIKIYNRDDKFAKHLNAFDIFIDGVKCASHTSTVPFLVKTFNCEAIGQEVKVVSREMSGYMSLCEVQAFEEKALKLSKCSGSTSSGSDNACEKAFDGLGFEPNATSKGFQSEQTTNSWWAASTAWPVFMRAVRISNLYSDSSLTNSLNGFSISVDDVKCAFHSSDAPLTVQIFPCGLVGQEVKIQKLTSAPSNLNLQEVQVFGDDMIKLVSCKQSSTLVNCYKAIDRNTNQAGPSCSDTLLGEKSWWSAMTLKPTYVRAIRIFNRRDSYARELKNFDIFVNDEKCASDRSTQVTIVKTFKCDAIGQQVKIAQYENHGSLSLCEVQVFGEYL